MSPTATRPARPPDGGGRAARTSRGQGGSLSLESVLVLPVLALLTLGLLGTVTVLRDVLVLHEAARVGARAAATTDDNASVESAARAAAPEVDGLQLSISPPRRTSGDVVTVTARADRRLGPGTFALRVRAHARVEPTVADHGGPHPWWEADPSRTLGPVVPWTSPDAAGDEGGSSSDRPVGTWGVP